jgi:hypothetical protein
MTKPLTLRDLNRCPKCKSADIIGPIPIPLDPHGLQGYTCQACGHHFMTPILLDDPPKGKWLIDPAKPTEPNEFRPAETLEQNETEPLNITIATKGDVVHLDLGRRVAWFALPKAQACEFAIAILRHCGVDVNIRYKVEGQGGG